MLEFMSEWIAKLNLNPQLTEVLARAALAIAVVLLAWLANLLTKRVLLRVIRSAVKRSDTRWDDALVEKRLFNRAAHIAPAVVIYLAAGVPFEELPAWISATQSAATIYMLIVGALVIDALLNGVVSIYRTFDVAQRVPIRGFVQVVKVVVYFAIGIFVLSTLLNESPKFFLGGMGALTAVLMLVFKDPILGFVGGIQLTTNDMVRIGDWIALPKFGADGTVIDVSLTTVKVQNWDQTITMIPTYALISDSFKNWRGMSDAGGRRICRSLNIDVSSIRFCSDEMLDGYRKIEFIREYLERMEAEVAAHNAEHGVDGSIEINGRRLTNIGTFRAYVTAYLRNHARVHQEGLTFLVRQLAPGPKGLPIQVYVFTKTTAWVEYEGIQADIFDHLLAAAPEFDLRVFQDPTDIALDVRLHTMDGEAAAAP
jgi:miniconductance mechanosensitive channel